MQKKNLLRWLLPLGIAAGSFLVSGSAVSAHTAATADVPVATAVPVATSAAPEVSNPPEAESAVLTGTWTDTADGRKYRYDDGSYAVNIQIIDGISYMFQSDGVQMTGWQNLDGVWHYYDPKTYAAAIGKQEINDKVYLFDYTGAQKTGWRTVDGVRRYYSPTTGKEIVGWITYDGKRYFVDDENGKLTGECSIGGIPYLLSEDTGIQQTGFQTFSDSSVHYYTTTGTPVYGWLKSDETGNTYYFDTDYSMQTGMKQIDGSSYYFAADGAMYTGWKTISEQKYYFGNSGAAATGLTKIDGQNYCFAENGVMQTGWQTLDSGTYYFSKKYGSAVTGKKTIDGKKYRFDDNGALRNYRICLDAGHYGKYNISPVNSAYYESDMSWKLHLYLKSALESYGFEVITTRPTQAQDLALEQRGKTAADCDLFLSLHSNATNNTYADGPLACCTVTGTADDLGLQLANLVHEVMGTQQGGSIWKRVGMNGDYYGVLRGATSVGVPAILLEHSYHTNPAATAWLLVNSNLERMAKAEAKLLASYFGLI